MAIEKNKLSNKPNAVDPTSTEQPGTGGTAAATARSLMEHAKETAGQAYEAVTEKAATTLDQKKVTLSDGLTTVADSIRQVGENLGGPGTDNPLAGVASKYSNTAAKTLQDVARYFEQRDIQQMVRDVEGFARRNPAIFIGAAFGLGFLAARFLKSSQPDNSLLKISTTEHGLHGQGPDEVESGQGIQMDDRDFRLRKGAQTPSPGTPPVTGGMPLPTENLGNPAAGVAGGTKKSGTSSQDKSSTRDSIRNPM